jgi:hypothetical protein
VAQEESEVEESEDEILDQEEPEDPRGAEAAVAVPKILMTYEVEESEEDAGGCSEEDIDSLKVEHLTVPVQEAKLKVTRSFSVPTITKGEYRFDQPRLVQDTHIDILLDQNQTPQAARYVWFRPVPFRSVSFSSVLFLQFL